MQQFLLDLVHHYGYAVVLLGVGMESMGVPVPGETTLLIGAVFAGRGDLSAAGVGAAGWLGAVVGDNIGYLVGRRWAQAFLSLRPVRRVYTPERIAAADHFFQRFGWPAVFLGRFVALLRIFAGPLAGLHHMPWPRFLAANASGALVWVAAVVALGLVIGDNLDRAAALLSGSGYAGLILFAAAISGAVLLRHRHRRRGG